METIKIGSKSADVLFMQAILSCPICDGIFGGNTENYLKNFQSSNNLLPDGICGPKTWEILLKSLKRKPLSNEDIKKVSEEIGCDYASIMAVREIESGGSGFTSEGRPKILFEGHVFWSELKKLGLDPNKYLQGNQNILYPKWTKQFYTKGGDTEYTRINKAFLISSEAALKSASCGLFQIMGNNFKLCNCQNPGEYWKKSFISELEQFKLFINFINSRGLVKYLKEHNFSKFAYYYNGPGYAQNQYDIKLEKAYNKYK